MGFTESRPSDGCRGRFTANVHCDARRAALSAACAAVAVVLLATIGAAPAAAQNAADAAAVDTTITIETMGSALEFLPSRISAKEGTRVRVLLVNEGTLPHNIVLVKDESDIDALGSAAFQAKDTEYVPLDQAEKMIAYSELAAPGETVEMTFEVPPAGRYWFVCLYPGHYNMMVGTLTSLSQ